MHNPGHVDQRFRWMPSTRSGPCRPPVPVAWRPFFGDIGISGRLGLDSVDDMPGTRGRFHRNRQQPKGCSRTKRLGFNDNILTHHGIIRAEGIFL
jgi:hypothetical protein